ncbi:hypothetical protein R6Q57_009365 [Mikania cordata]
MWAGDGAPRLEDKGEKGRTKKRREGIQHIIEAFCIDSNDKDWILIKLGTYKQYQSLGALFSTKSHIKYNDPKLRRSIEEGFYVPMYESELNRLISKYADLFTENDILLREKDDKAYASITMALSTEVAHSFKEHKTAKELWDALVERFEGNEHMRESRKDMLRQRFNMFNHIKGEILEAQLYNYQENKGHV